MINSMAFATRLKELMEYYNLSASAFSDEIDFNRSTISHLISGRNKPSLEFVMKVLDRFPEVSVSWFLYGKGEFPAVDNKESFTTKPTDDNKDSPSNEKSKSPNVSFENRSDAPSLFSNPSNNKKEIKKIVIFYTDFSFETYEN